MSEYLSPGVFIEDNPNPPVIEAVSASNGGFAGIAQRGVVGKPIFINSWNAFINHFAYGMESPFLANSHLAYAVYGFFQNGGKRCYVMRVASKTAKIASMTKETLVIQAKDAGAWGNKLKVTVTANADTPANFDLKVTMDTEDVEVFKNLSNTLGDENYWIDVLNQSKFIEGVSGSLSAIEATALTEGNDGVTDIQDTDFTEALKNFNVIDDLNLLCIPGQTSDAVNKALMTYCENRKDVFAILDAPEASTVDSVIALRKSMSCKNAALYFPWIKVADPLSKTGKLRSCPPCGHVMGVYARTIAERGVWKAPAGTEAIVRGAIEVNTTLTTADTDMLNPAGIVSILPKTNYGIVIWGARNLHPDSSMKYVSDVLLDINIKKSVFNGTQPFVFEPNDSHTWTSVVTTVQAFLDTLWRDGALNGKSANEAYYVKCDEDLNPADVRNQGKLICEVGYANKKPAEFVVFRFSHDVASN